MLVLLPGHKSLTVVSLGMVLVPRGEDLAIPNFILCVPDAFRKVVVQVL